MIDWVRLLTDNQIPYATAGAPNVSKGHLGIRCPFCGEDDPSFHCGINLTTDKWSCWRNKSHKGASPYYLLSALLGVSNAQAKLVAQAYSGAAVDDFDALTGFKSPPEGRIKPTVMQPEFEPIKAGTLTHKFWVYLLNRGLDDPDQVIEDYQLKCCLSGNWKGRLIIPVYGARNIAGRMYLTFNQEIVGSNPTEPTLIGWQGRSLRTVDSTPRYLTSHPEIKRTIYNQQNLIKGGDYLYICEGPMDAIKIDFYGKLKIRATCLFGATPTTEQIEALYRLASKFSQVVIMLDSDATGITAGFALSDWLPMCSFGSFPEGHKDTDKLSPEQMRKWLSRGGL